VVLTSLESSNKILSRYIEIVSWKGEKVGFFSSARAGRREERFGKGDIKYVILTLLLEKPSYGYEIIHAIEDRFGGLYTPSPGTIYPTLQMLEDLGYVTSAQTEGKKIYTITPAGTQFLAENKDQVANAQEHMSGWWDRRSSSEEMHEVLEKLKELRRILKYRRRNMDPKKIPELRAIIERTYLEIEALLKD
jgi:DNA-binding PadR family transcriptional regulator